MLFNFQSYIEELRNKEDKKKVVEDYENSYGKIAGSIQDQIWHKEYLKKFQYKEYHVPSELSNDFDWELLFQLVLGSFSSTYMYTKKEASLYELEIEVKSGNQPVIKTVSELWSFQILRLFEIYIEEQMNLQTLMKTDKEENRALTSERNHRLAKWKMCHDRSKFLECLGLTEND